MKVSDYNYEYSDTFIARHPPKVRGSSKLFVVNTETGEIIIDQYTNLINYLNSGDLIVRNNTKVFRARLFGKIFSSEGEYIRDVEVFLIEPHAQTLEEYVDRVYEPAVKGFRLDFMGTLKKKYCKEGYVINIGEDIVISELTHLDGNYRGLFKKNSGDFSGEALFSLIEDNAEVPLPPYLNRSATKEDIDRYQTIFAKHKGSVAAPTASLNFTKEIEVKAKRKKIGISDVTLHVGRGTFLPLKEEELEKNKLHSEPYYFSDEVSKEIVDTKKCGNRICAVGTTVTRVLESSYKIVEKQEGFFGDTELFIYPPFEFKIVDVLLTNFHFPGSSLITLVDAFLQYKKSKLTWREIYDYAMQNGVKLFSYGDSMLII